MENIGKILNRAFDLCKLNFKSIFKNKSLLLLLSIFFIISLLIAIIFIPYILIGSYFILLAVALPVLIILGWVSYNCRKSTMYKNMNITGMSKSTFYLGQIFTTFLLTIILSFAIWMIVWFLGNFNIFLLDWVWDNSNSGKINPFYGDTWINIIYITILSSVLIFSFYFFLNSFIPNQKFYYIFIVILFLFGIIFGGGLNTNFAKPPWNYTYNFEINDLVENEDYIYDSITKTYYITQENFDKFLLPQTNNLEKYKNIIEISGGLFPQRIFGLTLLFPFYGVGEFATTAITTYSSQNYYWNFDVTIKIVNNLLEVNNPLGVNVLETYNYYFFDIHWYDWFVIDFSSDGWYWTMVILQPYIWIIIFTILGLLFSKLKNSKI